jgi:hypothetical protein
MVNTQSCTNLRTNSFVGTEGKETIEKKTSLHNIIKISNTHNHMFQNTLHLKYYEEKAMTMLSIGGRLVF